MNDWYSSSKNSKQGLSVTSYTSLTMSDLQPHSPSHALELEHTVHFIHPFLITSICVFFLLHISFKKTLHSIPSLASVNTSKCTWVLLKYDNTQNDSQKHWSKKVNTLPSSVPEARVCSPVSIYWPLDRVCISADLCVVCLQCSPPHCEASKWQSEFWKALSDCKLKVAEFMAQINSDTM